MIDRFYIFCAFIAAICIWRFCTLPSDNLKARNQVPLQRYDTIYIDAFHCDSTGKNLINWHGDTCR